jgi:hypothetical protein
MADDTMPANGNDRPEQATSEPAGRQAEQKSSANATAPLDKRTAPGRKPLFRT